MLNPETFNMIAHIKGLLIEKSKHDPCPVDPNLGVEQLLQEIGKIKENLLKDRFLHKAPNGFNWERMIKSSAQIPMQYLQGPQATQFTNPGSRQHHLKCTSTHLNQSCTNLPCTKFNPLFPKTSCKYGDQCQFCHYVDIPRSQGRDE